MINLDLDFDITSNVLFIYFLFFISLNYLVQDCFQEGLFPPYEYFVKSLLEKVSSKSFHGVEV